MSTSLYCDNQVTLHIVVNIVFYKQAYRNRLSHRMKQVARWDDKFITL